MKHYLSLSSNITLVCTWHLWNNFNSFSYCKQVNQVFVQHCITNQTPLCPYFSTSENPSIFETSSTFTALRSTRCMLIMCLLMLFCFCILATATFSSPPPLQRILITFIIFWGYMLKCTLSALTTALKMQKKSATRFMQPIYFNCSAVTFPELKLLSHKLFT